MNDFTENIRQKMLAERFDVWRDFLLDLEMTAEKHTVVRFPNCASYIFSTGDVFWLVDPSFNYFDCKEDDAELAEIAFLVNQKISFAVITHLHPDHCQIQLVKKIDNPAFRWIVSKRFAEEFNSRYGVGFEQMIILDDGESAVMHGIRITAERGYHSEVGKVLYPSCSYNIELPDGVKIFMPADVRDFGAEIPDMSEVDYTFGHVFLGREDADGDEFSKLHDFAEFITRRKCGAVILAHLYELGRQRRDLWTHRHAAMAEDEIRKNVPEMKVYAPHFGEALHLCGRVEKYPAVFKNWNRDEQDEFLDNLGISVKKEHELYMERAIAEKIPVVEWNCAAVREVPQKLRMEQLDKWRKAGGRVLSMHMPDMFFAHDIDAEKLFAETLQTVVESECDRVTIHVPRISLAQMENDFDKIAEIYAEKLHVLIENNIAVGIENQHMKAHYKPDISRPFGFIPEECIAFAEKLRKITDSSLWGCHFDCGHAYSNYPYSEVYDTAKWIEMCGKYLNGLHLHQFECMVRDDKPYLVGHSHITSGNTGHPNMYWIFDAWQKGIFRAPMILETHKGREGSPFASLQRIRRMKEL